jgi:hypothetical protein
MKKLCVLFSIVILLVGCKSKPAIEDKLNIMMLNTEFISENTVPIKDGSPDPDGDWTTNYVIFIDLAIKNVSQADLKGIKVANAELINEYNESIKFDPDTLMIKNYCGATIKEAISYFNLEKDCAIVLHLEYRTKNKIFNYKYGDEDVVYARFILSNDEYSSKIIETEKSAVENAF